MNTDARPLLSRVADSLYWMARYIERAENVARYIGVNLNLQLDLPLDPASQWQPLIDTSGDAEEFKERYSEADQDSVVEFLAYDPENPNSIYSCLCSARENARSVRDTISAEMWAQINAIYLRVKSERSLPEPENLLDAFRQIRLACHMIQGVTDGTMTHNEAWHFLNLGRMLERADKTSRILDVKYFMLLPSTDDVGTPYDDIHWAAVLKSVSGFAMFRQKYGRITPKRVVDFLVIDSEFPRSIHFCLNQAADSLRAITGTNANSYRYRSEQLMGQLGADLDYTSVDAIIQFGLHEYLDGLQEKMNAIDASLREEFVLRRPAAQSQAQSQAAR